MKNIISHTCILLAFSSLVTGCSIPYRIDVDQGNIIEQKEINRLRVGMNKNQVQGLLGSSLLQDMFHKDRWDYVQRYKNGKTQKTEESKVSLFFTNGLLSRIEKSGYEQIETEPVPYSIDSQ